MTWSSSVVGVQRRLLILALLFPAVALPAAAQVSFTPRFTATDQGAVALIGNTLETCLLTDTAQPPCLSAQQEGVNGTSDNNGRNIVYVDVDNDPTTFNSSSALLQLNPGSTVLFAGLVWGGFKNPPASGPDPRTLALFQTPVGGGYQQITGQILGSFLLNSSYPAQSYFGFADVTALVQAGGNGMYTVANVQAVTGVTDGGLAAGWSLVVVYEDDTQPLRSLTVFTGFATISSGNPPQSASVSGFVTPPSGPTTAQIGVVALEGDRGITGDQMLLNNKNLSDALNPASNFFNSTISYLGTYITAKIPNFTNQLGWDVKTVQANNILPNSSTSLVVTEATITTNGDSYQSPLLTVAADVYAPVLKSTKSVIDLTNSSGPVNPGDVLQYTVTVNSTGVDTASKTVLVDAIPANTTYVPGTLAIVSGANAGPQTDAPGDDEAELNPAANAVVFRLGTGADASTGGLLPQGASTTIQFQVQIANPLPVGTTISNVSATTAVGATSLQRVVSTSPAAAITVNAAPDLTISKTNSGQFIQGSTGTFTLVVQNLGPTATSGTVTVTDTLPTGLTATSASGAGWACTPSGQLVTCTRSDSLALQTPYVVMVNVAIAPNAALSLTDTATVSGGGDNTPDNNTATDTVVITPGPDLAVSKTHTGVVFQGLQGLAFTILVTNVGGAPAIGADVVADSGLPAGLTPTLISGTGWTCTLANLDCTRNDPLPAGTSYPPITILANVATNAPPSVVNTVAVNGQGDVNPDNNTSMDTVNILPGPDPAISKSHTGFFSQGQIGASYTITVSNQGGVGTIGLISVADVLPSGLIPISIAGTGWACTIGPLACMRSDVLAPAASYPPITLTVNVASNAPASLVNTATVSGGADVNPANNTAMDPTTIVAGPDITIGKTHAVNFFQGEVGATYMITVSNAGGAASTGAVTVTDILPTGLTATAAAGSGWTCSTPLSCTRSDALAAGSSYPPLTLTVNVAANAPTSLINTVSVAGGGDINPNNNTATDTTFIGAGPDLSIAKTHTGHFFQGQMGALYTITITNVGRAPTSGAVTVGDTLPTGLTATAASGTGWTCSTPLSCTRSDPLEPGASYPPITLAVNVATNAPATAANTATVTNAEDVNPANNTATDPTTIFVGPDLTISKMHTGNFTQGQSGFLYTITVSNVGGVATSGPVTVADTLPTGLTATSASGSGWTCGSPTSCTRSDVLAPGASYPPITLTVSVAVVANNPVLVTNSATVSGGGDVNPNNNTANDPTTLIRGPDLTVQKTHSSNFTQGQQGAAYNIKVINVGGSATSGAVTITDIVPTGLTVTALSGSGWNCTVTPASCTRSDVLAPGASYPLITLTVNVAHDAPAQVTNTATVSGGGDTNPDNNSASDPTEIVGGPDLSITKTHSGSFGLGQKGATYTITVTNVGSTASTGEVDVRDTLPAGLTATVMSGTGWTCVVAALACSRSDALAAKASYPPITLTVNVATNAPPVVTNTASVSGGGDDNPSNNTATDSTVIRNAPDLAISKSHSGNFARGSQGGVYTLRVKNVGAAPTLGEVTVIDTLPAGLTIASFNGLGSWTCLASSASSLSCTRSDSLAPGNNYPPITLTVNVASDAPNQVTNTATVSGGGDVNPDNNTATDLTILGAGGNAPFICAVTAAPALVRMEGLAELVGDILLTCTGGSPTPTGQPVPLSNIQMALNTNITSRILGSLSEAMLIVNEAFPQIPIPPTAIPQPGAGRPQLLCAASGGAACEIIGTNGVGVYSGQPGHPNLFQGIPVQAQAQPGATAVAFLGVPIDPPGANSVLTLRITNIRANASSLGSSTTNSAITANIAVNGTQQVTLDNPTPEVARIAPGLQTLVTPSTQMQCQSPSPGSFGITFTEGFAASFKSRNIGSTTAADSNIVAPQNVPGYPYNTESGFYAPISAGPAGLADHGTRLFIRLTGVPAGVTLTFPRVTYLWPTSLVPPDPTSLEVPPGFGAPTGELRLVATDMNGDSAPGATYPASGVVTLNAGTGYAAYEVVFASPNTLETTGPIPIDISYTPDVSQNIPAPGQATVQLSFGPLSSVVVEDPVASLPRFTTQQGAQSAFAIVPCMCNLLFPYVTNQAGFDTGLAIANTTTDPFGTQAQSGTVTLYYYGGQVGGAAPLPQTSQAVPSGGELTFTLSSGGNFGINGTPGFQGYMIAQAKFQYCHGYAFISDMGATQLAEGYLALVLDDPGLLRTGQTGESQGR